MTSIIVLLLAIHFLCDYSPLSTAWMLAAKRMGKPLYPIFCHAFVHASLMLAALSFYGLSNGKLLSLFFIQLTTHFIIDTLKGKLNVWVPTVASPANKSHWIVFGLDQLMHQFVIILMAWIAINK